MGLSIGPAAVRPRDPGPGRAAEGHPRADPRLHADRHAARARLPGRGGEAPAGPQGARAPRSSGDRPSRLQPLRYPPIATMAIEFAEKLRRIPVYPAADGYASEGPDRHARLQRVALSADPGGDRGGRRRCSPGSTATRTRRTRRCARKLSRPHRRPRAADRDRQRLLRHPARRRRRAARARRRARLRLAVASASTRTWRPRRARARSRSRSTTSTTTSSTRWREEITAATRLVIVCNPNNPTSTALPLDEIADVRRSRSRATSR